MEPDDYETDETHEEPVEEPAGPVVMYRNPPPVFAQPRLLNFDQLAPGVYLRKKAK